MGIGVLIHSLLVGGILILLAAIVPVGKLILHLPGGQIRTWWRILSLLIYLFVAGYIVYGVLHWGVYDHLTDLIVPMIFFFGAVFVLLVSTLSLNTANDIKRIFTLEYESTTDSLLGIYNRRYLEKRLHEEFFRSKRYEFPLSVLMVDIDFFKQVNDRFGHQVGDQVLKRLAELLVLTVRESDVVARYGGEEFLLVMPHTKGVDGHRLAERLRFAVENTVLVKAEENELNEDIQVTVSLGVATLVAEMTSSQQLVKQADKALYYAKEGGRNMVTVCPNTKDEKMNLAV